MSRRKEKAFWQHCCILFIYFFADSPSTSGSIHSLFSRSLTIFSSSATTSVNEGRLSGFIWERKNIFLICKHFCKVILSEQNNISSASTCFYASELDRSSFKREVSRLTKINNAHLSICVSIWHLLRCISVNVWSFMIVDKRSYTAADDCEVKEIRRTVFNHLTKSLHIKTKVLKQNHKTSLISVLRRKAAKLI